MLTFNLRGGSRRCVPALIGLNPIARK